MTSNELAIIVPVFNEEKTINLILKRIKNQGDVILIDDNSTDNTFKIANEHKIIIIKNESNIGYSKSIKKGLLFAKEKGYQYAITFDGDGEHNPKYIKKFHKLLKKKFSLIIGSRDKKNRLTEILIGFFTKIIFKVEDPFCGFKGYNLKEIKTTDKYFSFDMEDVNTFLMISILKKDHLFCNLKIKVSKRFKNITSRFGLSLNGELKILKAIKYWL